jgi:predicted nucleotidyltransferase
MFPTKKELVRILRNHPLIKLKGKVKRAFVIGSFAKGTQNEESDIDVLLEVFPVAGFTEDELTQYYRRSLQNYFMKHNLHGKHDEIHPQWNNRRIDLYLTYDMSSHEKDIKIELD